MSRQVAVDAFGRSIKPGDRVVYADRTLGAYYVREIVAVGPDNRIYTLPDGVPRAQAVQDRREFDGYSVVLLSPHF